MNVRSVVPAPTSMTRIFESAYFERSLAGAPLVKANATNAIMPSARTVRLSMSMGIVRVEGHDTVNESVLVNNARNMPA